MELSAILRRLELEYDSEYELYIHKRTQIPLTVHYDEEKSELVLLDQLALPYELKAWKTKNWLEAVDPGIKGMVVRGSQAIGCVAAYAVLLAANKYRNSSDFMSNLVKSAEVIKSARPTAYPLVWAVDLVINIARSVYENSHSIAQTIDAVKSAADFVLASDLVMCWFLRQEGKKFLRSGDVIMTHCNGGSLSSSYGGHALGMIEEAYVEGTDVLVVSKETRPRSQGYKLTVWELNRAGVPVVIVTDNMISSAFIKYGVSKVILGVDRIARDGSVANKIGSADIAYISALLNVPFYYATSYNTIDLKVEKGEDIPIEERSPDEVTWYYKLEIEKLKSDGLLSEKSLSSWPASLVDKDTPSRGEVKIYNPAFDITPPKFIDLIITDIGVFSPEQIKTLSAEVINKKVRERLEKWGLKTPYDVYMV